MRDGQFNPDAREVDDIGNFDDMANAVLFNALAWVINGSDSYAENVASWVNTWFLDDATGMNPNLNYAQMQRGPTGQNGTHTGILYVFLSSGPSSPCSRPPCDQDSRSLGASSYL